MSNIKLALDWTPNINHIGFFVAKELGLYNKVDIELEIISPSADNYSITPAKKLEQGIADFAIAPFETIISLNNKPNKVDAIAVFAILQNDLSSIATLSELNINSPKQLDNKIYASYKARYEDLIVKKMIINDGGLGEIEIIYPDKLGIWNTLLQQKATSTWIFDNWEGVEALNKNIKLNKFRMADFGIPYGYSPILATTKRNITVHQEKYKRFISATKEGFLYTQTHPEESIRILESFVTEHDLLNINLRASLEMTSIHFGNSENCGKMDLSKVRSFLEWLTANKLEDGVILEQDLFTNELIE